MTDSAENGGISLGFNKVRKTMKIKRLNVILGLMLFVITVYAQQKRELILPDIPGYKVLKCDFHMHTVFSDGMVWPTTRVIEASAEGLDAIAITDHIEYRPKLKEFTSADHNRSYEIAKKEADDRNVILIHGTEITRKMAPGHFNTIFINDANPFENFVNKTDTRDGSNIAETLAEGKRQNGFVFWNHPWFQNPKDISEWFPIHEELYKAGLISGIEVVNGDRYDPVILQWCLDKNLTILSNSDIHTPMYLDKGEYRSMTIVLAGERSEESIKEALMKRRTLAYSKNHLYGNQEWLSPVFQASVQVKGKRIDEKRALLTLKNTSGMKYELSLAATDQFKIGNKEVDLEPLSENIVQINGMKNSAGSNLLLPVKVKNMHTGADTVLEIKLPISWK